MTNLREMAGTMSEEELDALLDANVSGGTSPAAASSMPCAEMAVAITCALIDSCSREK